MTNLWSDLETGPNPPETITVVVECLEGERNKYEYDEDRCTFYLNRVLHSSIQYPTDYGFVPRTVSEDDDPLDVFVLLEDQTFPGCVIRARPVGVQRMEEDGETDDNVIAVPLDDPRYEGVRNLEDLTDQQRATIDEFSENFKRDEDGTGTEVLGWGDKAAAKEVIEQSMDRFDDRFEGPRV